MNAKPGRCSGFCDTHRRSIHACLEDGTALAGSPDSVQRAELKRLRAVNQKLRAQVDALERSKLARGLRARIRELERLTTGTASVREAAIKALRRVAAL